VIGKDLRDKDDTLAILAGEAAIHLQVERRGAPEGPPSPGDGLRAGAVSGGEEGDDICEHVVGEAPDLIGIDTFFPTISSESVGFLL